jgi:hypothetical protein
VLRGLHVAGGDNQMKNCLLWGAALFSIAAGLLWLVASLVPSPEKITAITIGDTGFEGDLPKLFQAVRRQSVWNRWAAGAASVAAVLQGITLLL